MRPGVAGSGRRLTIDVLWPNRRCPLLRGSNAVALFERQYEDLPVADAAGVGSCGFQNRLDCWLDKFIIDGNFQFHLGDEPDHSSRAAEVFAESPLPSAAAN